MSDGELVRQARAGRAGAYEELVRRWAPRILAVCHAKVGRRGVAEDMAQEALLRGYRSMGTLADPEKFGSWLYGIAVRACLDWLKAKERTMVNFSSLGERGNPEGFLKRLSRDDDPALDREDEQEKLLAEVEALPEEYREVLMLFYHHDMKYRDMAQLLGVSSATINARLTRARALLRERLGSPRR